MVQKIRCPRCNSTELTINIGMNGGRMYLCKKCGYLGPLAIEWDDDEHAPPAAWKPEAGEYAPAPWWAKIFALWYLWYVAASLVMIVIFLIAWLWGF